MYLKIVFAAANYTLRSTVSSYTVGEWIARLINGTSTINDLPADAFAKSACVLSGSKPSSVSSVTFSAAGGDDSPSYLQITKAHHSVTGATRKHRLYHSLSEGSPAFYWRARVLVDDGQWMPYSTNASGYWSQNGVFTTNVGSQFNAYTNGAEINFFLSDYWTIFTFKDTNNRGGTSAALDYEATGQDTFAYSLNSYFYPGVYLNAEGHNWITAAQPTSEGYKGRARARTSVYPAYDGITGVTTTFRYEDSDGTGSNGLSMALANPAPNLFPIIGQSMYPTRDAQGNSQNYLHPVYCNPSMMGGGNTTSANSRFSFWGKIPYFYRSSDYIGQTGDEISIQGVSYRVIRMHRTGGNPDDPTTANGNPACYLVPSTISGV